MPPVATASHGLHPSSHHETPTQFSSHLGGTAAPQEPQKSSPAQGHRLEIKGGNCLHGYIGGQPSQLGHQPQIQPRPNGGRLRGLRAPSSGRRGPPLLRHPQLTWLRPLSPTQDGVTGAPSSQWTSQSCPPRSLNTSAGFPSRCSEPFQHPRVHTLSPSDTPSPESRCPFRPSTMKLPTAPRLRGALTTTASRASWVTQWRHRDLKRCVHTLIPAPVG